MWPKPRVRILHITSRVQNKTKISKEAPEWFHVVPEWKAKKFDEELIKKEDTISVFSRYQNWITVTPRSKDRRHPLEKIKPTKKEDASRTMPKWMELKSYPNLRLTENLKSVSYHPEKSKAKKMMIWVDKDLNQHKPILTEVPYDPSKSIFSLGDFRQNVITKEETKYFNSRVSQKPKKFFDWDDGKRFNPKYKNDI